MKDKRMFSLSIVNSDKFLDLSPSAQMLYFHYAMRADDDGFLENPRTIRRMIGAADTDIKQLINNGYIIEFPESGVIAVTHWQIHNSVPKDRYKETVFQDDFKKLITENGVYRLRTAADDEKEAAAKQEKPEHAVPDPAAQEPTAQEQNETVYNPLATCLQSDNRTETERKQNVNGDFFTGTFFEDPVKPGRREAGNGKKESEKTAKRAAAKCSAGGKNELVFSPVSDCVHLDNSLITDCKQGVTGSQDARNNLFTQNKVNIKINKIKDNKDKISGQGHGSSFIQFQEKDRYNTAHAREEGQNVDKSVDKLGISRKGVWISTENMEMINRFNDKVKMKYGRRAI